MTDQLYIVMGVSGCGKSSIGQAFAADMDLVFHDGDDLHPQANIEKMSRGEPLDDADRWPWLDLIGAALKDGSAQVIACSALKRSYRERIAKGAGRPVTFLYLQGSKALLTERMSHREGHFMPVKLLETQLATLEEPQTDERAITVSIAASPDEIVASIREELQRRFA